MEKNRGHCFGPLVDKPIATKTIYEGPDTNDIVEYEEFDAVKKIGEGEQDFIVEKKVRECSRINRQDMINSHREDVGIMNILKKVQLTGDVALFNQTGRVPQIIDYVDENGNRFEKVVDISEMPDNKTDAAKAVETGVNAFDNLPADLKGKMSMESFVNEFGADQIQEYINKLQKKDEAPGASNEGE